VETALAAGGTYYIGVTSGDDLGFIGSTAAGGYRLCLHLVQPPRVLVPGHLLGLVAKGFVGTGITTDPATGAVYSLARPDFFLEQWRLFRWAGGSLIRSALVRADRAEDAGRAADPATRLVAGLPRRLGLRLPR